MIILLTGCHYSVGQTAPSGITATDGARTTASPEPTTTAFVDETVSSNDFEADCSNPVSRFATYGLEGYPNDTSHRVKLGDTRVPSSSMWISGSWDRGYLCVSPQYPAAVGTPVSFAVPSRSDAVLTYFSGLEGAPFGAVPPTVTKVVVTYTFSDAPPWTVTFTADSAQDFRAIGDGWHVFNLGIDLFVQEQYSVTAMAYHDDTRLEVLTGVFH